MIFITSIVMMIYVSNSMAITSDFQIDIWGAQQIPEDWNTAFITGIQVIDGDKPCPDGTRALFSYDWMGTKFAYTKYGVLYDT